jgi:hypothetical protein
MPAIKGVAHFSIAVSDPACQLRTTRGIQFTCAPENRTILAHFSVSAAMVRR